MSLDRVNALSDARGAKEALLRANGGGDHDGGRTTAMHLDLPGPCLKVEVHCTGHAERSVKMAFPVGGHEWSAGDRSGYPQNQQHVAHFPSSMMFSLFAP